MSKMARGTALVAVVLSLALLGCAGEERRAGDVERLTNLEDAAETLADELGELEDALEVVRIERDELASELEESQEELRETQAELQQRTAELEEAYAEVSAAQEQLDELLDRAGDELACAEPDPAEIEALGVDLFRAYTGFDPPLDVLEEIVDEGVGFVERACVGSFDAGEAFVDLIDEATLQTRRAQPPPGAADFDDVADRVADEINELVPPE